VISLAVRWYLRYGLSYRDVEELLAERGITVDHVTVYRWVQRFTPEFIEAARPCRHAPGGRWFADETYLKVAGKWTYLFSTGRSISMARSLTCCCPCGVTWRPRGGSSPGRCARARSRPRSRATAPALRPAPGSRIVRRLPGRGCAVRSLLWCGFGKLGFEVGDAAVLELHVRPCGFEPLVQGPVVGGELP